MKIEIGGGLTPRGDGWLNVDRRPQADCVVDLEDGHLPFPDASVDAVYSAHTFEHVTNLIGLLREIGRVCKSGAQVEIRVPHWLSSMAMCHDHKQVIPPEQIEHWCETAIPYWWGDCPRRLRLAGTETIRSGAFDEAQRCFQWLSPDQIMRFVPGAAHEIRYSFIVVPNV